VSRLENVGDSTSHNPMGLRSLLRDNSTFFICGSPYGIFSSASLLLCVVLCVLLFINIVNIVKYFLAHTVSCFYRQHFILVFLLQSVAKSSGCVYVLMVHPVLWLVVFAVCPVVSSLASLLSGSYILVKASQLLITETVKHLFIKCVHVTVNLITCTISHAITLLMQGSSNE
jgi:hypothetical protein